MNDLRLYSFVNALYMKEIQWGIQTAHVIPELFLTYDRSDAESLKGMMLSDWASSHKTIIILNGGNYGDLHRIWDFLNTNTALGLPYARFAEDYESLGGILTCVGVVVPQQIYDAVNYRTFINTVDNPQEAGQVYDRSHLNSWFWKDEEGTWHCYEEASVVGRFLAILKSCGLAR